MASGGCQTRVKQEFFTDVRWLLHQLRSHLPKVPIAWRTAPHPPVSLFVKQVSTCCQRQPTPAGFGSEHQNIRGNLPQIKQNVHYVCSLSQLVSMAKVTIV